MTKMKKLLTEVADPKPKDSDTPTPPPDPNAYQVGGNHYQKVEGEQHWDRLIRLFGWEHARTYFIGNITAYIERYLLKDGIRDLKKAQHYLAKLIAEEEKHQQRNQESK